MNHVRAGKAPLRPVILHGVHPMTEERVQTDPRQSDARDIPTQGGTVICKKERATCACAPDDERAESEYDHDRRCDEQTRMSACRAPGDDNRADGKRDEHCSHRRQSNADGEQRGCCKCQINYPARAATLDVREREAERELSEDLKYLAEG